MEQLSKIIPKPVRGIIYAVAVIAFLVAANLDGTEPDTVAAWIDNASEIATAIGSALALTQLRDPDEGTTK